jgi:Beta-lactamase enzyme family
MMRSVRRIAAIALLAVLVAATGAARQGSAEPASPRPARPTPRAAPPSPLTTANGIRRARRFGLARQGYVAFAVLDGEHRPRGLHRTVRFASASVTKAMLLVAVLRRSGRKRLSDSDRALLRPMITSSDNDAANAVYARVGGTGLRRVARAAGMTRFADVGHWAGARITATDQARLFLRIDRLVPKRHRRYARSLLSSIVKEQRWGIAPVARRKRARIFFKGGWRTGITHQVALLERNGRRVALAVLTNGSPSIAYGEQTIERIAGRVITRPKKRRTARLAPR